MKLIYHRLAARDVREIIVYYEKDAGTHLADRFFDELITTIEKIKANPQHFSPLNGTEFRRANLTNFPIHLIYEVRDWGVKVIVVRHHRRNPNYGLRRDA